MWIRRLEGSIMPSQREIVWSWSVRRVSPFRVQQCSVIAMQSHQSHNIIDMPGVLFPLIASFNLCSLCLTHQGHILPRSRRCHDRGRARVARVSSVVLVICAVSDIQVSSPVVLHLHTMMKFPPMSRMFTVARQIRWDDFP